MLKPSHFIVDIGTAFAQNGLRIKLSLKRRKYNGKEAPLEEGEEVGRDEAPDQMDR